MNDDGFASAIGSQLKDVEQSSSDISFSPPHEDGRFVITSSDVELENGKLDLLLKEKFARYTLWITYGWLALTMLLFFVTGVFHSYGKKFLSDSVLIALISGTSLSVITGLVTTILKYLFSKRA
ncbi:MAG: hypothetical protein IJH79_19465 [Lentisphaeria bacterium]|nr:hypothetical protein [Lentisphaeria bacterium]